MHKAMGTALAAVGIVIAVLGLAIVAILGPDGRFRTGPHPIDTDGVAVVTAPGVISWKNLDVELLAEVPARKPVFVGIGNSVDVQAYLRGVRRLEVTEFETPWKLKTKQIAGRDGLGGAPTALSWWREDGAGLGGASLKLKLPDETVSAAILSVGSSNLRGLKVTFAYGLEGGFLKGLGLLLGGLGGAWAGLLIRRGESIWAEDAKLSELPTWEGDESPTQIISGLGALRAAWKSKQTAAAPDSEEAVPVRSEAAEGGHEVMYVYVDEDGVEHELTEQEAAEYEVVSVHVEELESVEADDDGDEDGPVTYFWVDEHGVEHEVSADDLHKYEIFDEDDES